MGLFGSSNSNKKKWSALLNEEDITEDWKFVINQFLIKDNISFEKFQCNYAVNQVVDQFWGLSSWRQTNQISLYPEPDLACTKSFEKYYSENRMNRSLGMPDWFYMAYPDVAHWFEENIEQIEEEFSALEDEYFGDKGINPAFFRIIIERYKNIHPLECAA